MEHIAADLGALGKEDISVAGFDDIPFAAFCDPPLTTIAQPAEAFRRHAVEMLVAQFAHRPFGLDCRGCDVTGMVNVALGLGAAMHELRDEGGASLMHSLDQGGPAVALNIGRQAWRRPLKSLPAY